MTTQFTASQIKLETADSGENITEIQNYLDTFNKEIEGGDGTATITAVTGNNFNFCNIKSLPTLVRSYVILCHYGPKSRLPEGL